MPRLKLSPSLKISLKIKPEYFVTFLLVKSCRVMRNDR